MTRNEPGEPEWMSATPLLAPRPEGWLVPLTVLVVLILWELCARAGVISSLFFPAPSTIFMTLVSRLAAGELTGHIAVTLTRVFLGFLGGSTLGIVLGLCMGFSPRLYAVLDPFIAAAYPIPKIAILPLIMIIFGIGEVSIVLVVALSTFFPVLISAMAGARQINPNYFQVALNYGARRTQLFTRILAPASLPFIMSGARIGLNTALLITIAVEVINASQGLGALIWLSWETLRMADLYVSLLLIVLLGLGSNLLLQAIAARLMPWQME